MGSISLLTHLTRWKRHETVRHAAWVSFLFGLLFIGLLNLNIVRSNTITTTFSQIIVPDQYLTIQEAVNNADDGDSIFVRAGTYYEHVVVSKTLSFIGEDRNTTIIDGSGSGYVMSILSDNVSVTGFTVQNGQFGIYVLNSKYANIFNNIITHNYGTDWDAGIRLEYADYTAIHDNIITDNWRGVLLYAFSPYVSVCGNNVTSNEYGIRVATGGSSYVDISGNFVADNRGYGIDVTGFGNEAQSNYATITRNLIVNNTYEAVGLGEGANYNTVTQNKMIGNGHAGVTLERYSNNNTIVKNDIIGNAYGICFDLYTVNSTQNTIFNNNIINNTQQIRIVSGSVNSWNSSYPWGGNYWSDYSGLDLFSGPYQNVTGSDGIGDTPYVIDANNIDNYPLINPWSRLLGDINDDRTVDIFDAILLAGSYNSVPGSPNWKPNADINGDNIVDIYDAIILANNYGKTI
jgi:nitrous oxidase accessory protein